MQKKIKHENDIIWAQSRIREGKICDIAVISQISQEQEETRYE